MSKYTPHELQDMARVVIDARAAGDPRATQLLIVMSSVLDIDPELVWHKIVRLAGSPPAKGDAL